MTVAQHDSAGPDVEAVVVVGAGPVGLGIARELKHRYGVDPLIVDRADAPAASWRARYDGFRLNTCGFWSHLPAQRMPWNFGRWPTRDQMVGYFDDYVRRQGLRLRLGVRADRIDRDGAGWLISTDRDGRIEIVSAVESFDADRVLLADGTALSPEVVIGATGYRHGLDALVGHLDVLADDGHPLFNGARGATAGLWFAGYEEPLIGPLRSFRRQAPEVAARIASHLGREDGQSRAAEGLRPEPLAPKPPVKR